IGFAGGVMLGGLLTVLTWMWTVLLTAGLTLSESVAVKLAVPVKPFCSVTVKLMFAVPCPLATVTLVTPVPGVADQLEMSPSSLALRLPLNGGALALTVGIGWGGLVIVGGWLTQRCVAEVVLRGFAAVAVKSAELLSVSLQPPLPRKIALKFEPGGG